MRKFFKGLGKKSQPKGTSPGPSPALGRRAGASAVLIGYDVKEKELSKLHKAAWTGDLVKVKQLAKKDPNLLDKENRTALHLACVNGHTEVVKELLEWKAKTNVGDNLGKTPLIKAVECQQEECVRLLIHDVDVDMKDVKGETSLHLAASVGNINITEILLDNRANVNLRNKAGCSPLHLAVTGKRELIAHRLLQDGADVDCIDSNERTPLMLACQDGNLAMVKLLLQNNCDTELKDVKGWSADDISVMQGHHSCSQLITDHNFRLKRPSSVASTPRSGASFLPGSAQNTPRQDDPSTGFGAPAGNLAEEDSGDETVSKASGTGGGYDSWNSDTDLSLATDDKKRTGAKVNLSKMIKNMSESDDAATPRSGRITEDTEGEVEGSKGKVQAQDSLSDHWSEPESPLAQKRSATRVSFKRDEELSQVHNISAQDEESSEQDQQQRRILNNGQPEVVEGYTASVGQSKTESQQMSQEKMRALMDELGISDADDITDVDFSEEASVSIGDNSHGNQDDGDNANRPGILKNWKQPSNLASDTLYNDNEEQEETDSAEQRHDGIEGDDSLCAENVHHGDLSDDTYEKFLMDSIDDDDDGHYQYHQDNPQYSGHHDDGHYNDHHGYRHYNDHNEDDKGKDHHDDGHYNDGHEDRQHVDSQYPDHYGDGYDRPKTDQYTENGQDYQSNHYTEEDKSVLESDHDAVEHLDEISSDEQGDEETHYNKNRTMKRWSGSLHGDDYDVQDLISPNSLSERVTETESQLGYTDETELDDFVIPVKLKRAKSLEEVDGDPEENSEWDSDVEGMLSPRQTHESLRKQEALQESDWDSTVDSVTPRNQTHNQYQQLKEEAISEDVVGEGHTVGVSVDDMDLNLEEIAPAQSTPMKSSPMKPSPMRPSAEQDEDESAWDSEDELSHQDAPPKPVIKPAAIGQSAMGLEDESEEEEEESVSEWELERQRLKEEKQREEEAREREQLAKEERDREQKQREEEEQRRFQEAEEKKIALEQQRRLDEEAEQRRLEAEREREEAEREQQRVEAEQEEAERKRQIQEEFERQKQEVERLQELEEIERQKQIMEAEQQQREDDEEARRLEEHERQRTWEEDEKTRLATLEREAKRELQIEEELTGHQVDHFESSEDVIRQENVVLQTVVTRGPNGEELDRIHREQVTGNRSSNHPIEPGPANPSLEAFVRMSLQSDGNSYDEEDSMMSDNFPDSPRDNRHQAGMLGAGSIYSNLGIPPDDDGLSYTSTEDFGGELQTVPYGRDILSGMTFGDSTAAIKLQEQIREQKRLLEREKSQKTLMENKNRLLLKENDDLQRKVQDLSEQRSSLEQVKLDLDAKNRSLAYNLNEETEKKKNADVLLLKTKEQLDRKEELYTSEMEAKQKAELSMRNVQMELRAAQSAIKQITDEKHDLERHLSQEKSARVLQEQLNEEQQRRLRDTSKTNNQLDQSADSGSQSQDTVEKLRAEVYALKMEIDRQRARFKDDQSVLTNENEELQAKIDDLKNDLKLNEEALAHATMQYNVQLSSLGTEKSMLSATLDKERATRDKLEAELESMRSRQHTASLELERSQQARSEAERMHQREKEDFSKQLDRREQELSTSKDNLQTSQQRTSTAEAKLSSLQNEMHTTSSSLIEKSTVSSQLQRELDQLRSQHNNIDENFRKEKEQVNKLQVKLESAQDRVNVLQHENLTLKQQLETAQHTLNDRTGLDINEKFSAMLSSLKSDHDKSRSSLEDKNSSMSEMSNRLKEELRNSDNKRNNLEQELRRLNQDYNDAMKRYSSAEASLDILNRSKNQLEQDCNHLRMEAEKSNQKYQIAHEKTLELQGRITELVDRLERTEHTSMVSSQQLAQNSANLQAFHKTRDEIEENVHKLQVENARLEMELKHERQRLELLQRDLDDSQKVRSSLEALCSNLKSSNAHLEDKLGEFDDLTVDQLDHESTVTRTTLHQEAVDNKDLWEKEVLSRSKLGLRIAQLDRQKQEVIAQLEEEKRRVRKALDSKRLVETKLEAEVDKNSLLQKEIVHLRAYLKSAKKKLKLHNIDDCELTSPLVSPTLLSSQSTDRTKWVKQLNELQTLLQDEMDQKDLLHSNNRTLESLISPSKTFPLDKNRPAIGGAFLSQRLSVENGFVEDFEAAQIKREMEAKYRMELNRKLEDVNHYLEEQSQARDRLDHVRNNNEASLKLEKRKLEEEMSEIKLKYEQAMAEKQSKDLEARRFRDLYDGEMKWRMKLGDQLQRSTEKSYDYKSRLTSEQQRSRLYGSVGNLNSTLMGDNPYLEKGRISNRLDTDDPLNRRLKAELDRSIAKHLEAGPHDNLKPIIRHVEENPVLNSSLAKSNADYLALLKRKYFV